MTIDNVFGKKRTIGEMISLEVKDGLVINMVWCPPGDFIMGTTGSEIILGKQLETQAYGPYQTTITKGFWISQTLVTEGL
jgi:hypothetical protein